ncbi:MAG: arginine repressor [Ruminococcaceae bacterium]|nr:arginine repressor [Oscillospiraceae bacterium]
MKNSRQKQILQLIAEYEITTQEDLIEKLRESGFTVTQATISRDIKQLKLIKIAGENDTYKYAVSGEGIVTVNAKYTNILMETVTEVDYAGNLIVVKTFNGMAMAAGAAIDAMKWNGVLGCIAGDDTIFIAMRSEAFAKEISDRIITLISAG